MPTSCFEHARRVQAGGGDQPGDVHERPHVFLRRRRVHHDEAGAAAVAIDAEVAAKAGVARRRAQARGDAGRGGGPTRASQAANALARAASARRWSTAAGERRGVTAGDTGCSQVRCRDSLVDNRFYKSVARRRGCRHRLGRRRARRRPRSSLLSPASSSSESSPLAKIHDPALTRSGPARTGCSQSPPPSPAAGAGAAGAGARREPAPAWPAAPPAAPASAPPASSCAAPTTLQAPPRGDAARQLPIILRAREVRGRPDLDAVGRRRRRVPARRDRDPRRPAQLRPGRGPGARHRPRRRSAATATSSAAPSCS